MEKLPESILCHILSFLPTKTAIKCSLISKRWHNLWSSVPVLDFDLDDLEEADLLLHRDVPIKIIRLNGSFSPHDGDYLHACAAASGLEELHLRSVDITSFPKGVTFNNLLVLKLSLLNLGSIEPGCFPKLKVLHLSLIDFYETKGGSLENLLSACPVLEELRKQGGYEDHNMKICVPTLTSLVVVPHEHGRRFAFDIWLETPLLEYLRFDHPVRESPISANLCNLRQACINPQSGWTNYGSYGSCVMKLISLLSSVEFLKLSTIRVDKGAAYGEPVIRADGLVHGLDYSCVDELPVFGNLVRLELCIPSCDCALLLHLLQKFHSLEYISIDKKLHLRGAEANWKEPLQVPTCLSSTLSTFHFEGFEGYKAEVVLVNYVMKHAMVLKNFTVNTTSDFKESMERVNAVQELFRTSDKYQLDLN